MNATDYKAVALALIRGAVLAPSSHNTQPWMFRVSASHIDLLADRTRALPVNDPQDRELAISCGCALMNLRAAAAAQGLALKVDLLPAAEDPDWLARVAFVVTAAAPAAEAGLAQFIERRRTCRERFARREADASALDDLLEAAKLEGASLRPLSAADARQQAASLVYEGDVLQWANPAWRRELADWMHPRSRGDGLTVPALAAPIARLAVRSFDLGARVGAKDRDLAEASPLLAVLGTDGDRARDWLQAGQALERCLLTACRHGLQASYFNQPVQIAALRPRLQDLAGGGFPQVLLRFGYPAAAVPAAPRRDLEDVIESALWTTPPA